MEHLSVGKWLFFIGLGIAGLGILVWASGKIGLPLGKLPGDMSYKGENFSFYFPIVTSILLSIALTIILNIFFRFFWK